MSNLKLIIKREFNAKVRNKSFIIMTFLSPLLMVGMGFLIFFLSKVNNDKIKTIAYVDGSAYFTKEDFKDVGGIQYKDLTALGAEEAEKITEKDGYYGLLVIPETKDIDKLAKNIEFHSDDTPSVNILENIEDVIEKNLRTRKLEEFGINKEELSQANIRADIKLSNYSGEKTSKIIGLIKTVIGMGAGYLIMMFIIVYGASVMRSVIEEKTSRIIEVIISSVRPFHLMLGKIVGNAFAGLLQFAIWGVLIAIFGFVFTLVLGVDSSELATQTPQMQMGAEQLEAMKEMQSQGKIEQVVIEFFQLPLLKIGIMFILYFLGGYLLYSSIYAAIGAAVDNETDTQQFMLPVMIPLMLAVYVGFASVISDPDGPIAVAFSYIPLTSPIVMLMRIPFGVSWGELVISLVLLLLTFLGIVWFAAKIYRVGILMYGKKPTYKDLWKWLKY
ncbi:ABC transporter permease [Aureivirga sp. CE67]|uniref:ABC transporter permease n=1 Tax=Aureivirga sp. CE67 TaxID=1788983 RepID=UPI0018CA7F9F|nr:ABC transporter permease [Aureivirga sp. CE67]